MARKVVAIPASRDTVREAVHFAQRATPEARRQLTRNPSVSYREALAYDDRVRSGQSRREREAAAAAPNYSVFFQRMERKLGEWTVGIYDVVKLAGEVPPARQRGLRRQLEELIAASEAFLARMDSVKPTSPTVAARLVAKTAPFWEKSA